MPSKDRYTIGAKVGRETLELLKKKSEREGKSQSEVVREGLERALREDSDEVENKIREISFIYEIEAMEALEKLEKVLEEESRDGV